ncbi:hypothetical protein PP7435_CHR1-0861 [Komagataella phaffii CBS 7435]|uniref:Uncharacterized protein n=2 Tax=Komagataella phaffii TaxID=460519 RepID=C4QXE5_KOMPG|nr:Hypothetical protein PAS_chr1-4_0089 [Komagataella phaffii GS115]AOA60337.1 GQ67_02096T0 [Komagataella phaffii]CAH2446731.1 hypothetical protein BQ9382_C1-4530 [Komagataella phaffii CBS 7435]AOA65760.1 GQ68_02111T0 [Komagataella phaffii GS115]CAY67918.1 Hypothetical protein PAS_chr1-4_0089 [Komagataella phaffii GS115]CCA36997.1 hypothetical protein PP7435_CHR1-0861 [Komagataella phaffii CBS 7435]
MPLAGLNGISSIQELQLLKAEILGNDSAKQYHLNSSVTPLIDSLIATLTFNDNQEVLKNCSIILESFAYFKFNTTQLIKEKGNKIVDALIVSSLKHQELCEVNFKTIKSLLAQDLPECTINLSINKQGENLMELIYGILDLSNKNVSKELLSCTCKLIPYLQTPSLTRLITPLMNRLSVEFTPIFIFLLRENSLDNFTTSWYQMVPPHFSTPDLVSSEIVSYLFALSSILKHLASRNEKDRFEMPKPFYYVLTSFLRNEDLCLKLITINILILYFKNWPATAELKTLNQKKLLPSLITMIDLFHKTDGSNKDISLQLDDLFVSSNLKIIRKMSPLYLLSLLSEEDDINEFFADNNFIMKLVNIISKNYKPEKDSSNSDYLDPKSLYTVSDCLQILANITSNNEEYRDEIIKHDIVSECVVDLVSRHINIYKEFHGDAAQLDHVITILKLSNIITTSALYLVRSLSRSAPLLRTYLVDLNIVNSLTDLVKLPLVSRDNESCASLLDDEITLKALVLGIISNCVVEYSSLKKNVFNEDFLKVLSYFVSEENEFEFLKNNALSILRNYLYGDDIIDKKLFLDKVPLSRIFELCYSSNLQIQEKAFNIIRNLSCGPLNYSNKIIQSFCSDPTAKAHDDKDFLNFLLKNLKSLSSTLKEDDISKRKESETYEVILAITYILVHFAASNEDNRSMIICNQELLDFIYMLLETPLVQEIEGVSSEWAAFHKDLMISCIWIVTNLTWKDDTSSDLEDSDVEMDMETIEEEINVGYLNELTSDEHFKKMRAPRSRALKLIKDGFYDVIKKLSFESDNTDTKERARAAMFQLILFDKDHNVDE